MNDNLEIKKTDWNLYRKELNIYVDEKISFIQKFLEFEFSCQKFENIHKIFRFCVLEFSPQNRMFQNYVPIRISII